MLNALGQGPVRTEIPILYNASGAAGTVGSILCLNIAKGTNINVSGTNPADVPSYLYLPDAAAVTNGARCFIVQTTAANLSNVPALGQGFNVSALVNGALNKGDKLQAGTGTNAGFLVPFYASGAQSATNGAKAIAMALATNAAGTVGTALAVDFFGSLGNG